MFKIANNNDLYSKGGIYPSFSKQGKIWSTRNALSNHLALVNTARYYKDCVIVEYDMVVVRGIDINAWVDAVTVRRQKRNRSMLVRKKVNELKLLELRQLELTKEISQVKNQLDIIACCDKHARV